MELFSVKDKTVLISGASRGIGRALAEGFAQAGAIVYGTSSKESTIDWTKDYDISGSVADIRSQNDMKDLIQKIITKHGRLDCLINNAAIALDIPASAIKESHLEDILDTNVKGMFRSCQAYYKIQRKRGGNIINISSIVGLYGGFLTSIYAASKGAVLQMSKSLSLEWANSGFRLNTICPGFTQTDMTAGIRKNEQYTNKIIEFIPLKRMAQPQDMLGAAIFLASAASSYMTGATIVVDGGISRH